MLKSRLSKVFAGVGIGIGSVALSIVGVSFASESHLPSLSAAQSPITLGAVKSWWIWPLPEPTPTEPPYTGPCSSKAAEPCLVGRGGGEPRGPWYYERSSYWNGVQSYRNRPDVKLKESGLDDTIVRTYLNSPPNSGGARNPNTGGEDFEVIWNGTWDYRSACLTKTKTTAGVGTDEIGGVPLTLFLETQNFAYGINYSVKDDYWRRDFNDTWEDWADSNGTSRRYQPKASATGFLGKRTVTYQPPNDDGCMFHADPYIVSKQCTVSMGPISVDGPYGFGVNPEYNGVNQSSIVEGSVASVQTYKNSDGSDWKKNTTFGTLYKNYNNGRSLDDADQGTLINLLRTGCEETVSMPASVRNSVEMYGGGQFKIKKMEDYAVCNYWVYPGYNQYEFINCGGINTAARWDYGERICNAPFSKYSPNTLSRFNAAKYVGGEQRVFSLSECGNIQCTWTPPGTPSPADPKRTLQGQESFPFSNNQRLFTVPADGRAVNIQAPQLSMSVSDGGSPLAGTSTRWTIWELEPENEPWDDINDPERNSPNLDTQPFKGSVGQNGSHGSDKLWVDQKYANGDSKVMSQAGRPSTSGWHDTGANILALRFFRPADQDDASVGRYFKIQGHFHQLFRQPVKFDAVSSVGRQSLSTTTLETKVENIPKTCSIPAQTFHVVAGRNAGGSITSTE